MRTTLLLAAIFLASTTGCANWDGNWDTLLDPYRGEGFVKDDKDDVGGFRSGKGEEGGFAVTNKGREIERSLGFE